MGDSNKFLGIAIIILKVLGFASVIFGVISSVIILIGGGTPDAPRITSLLGLLLGALYFFIFYTFSEIIRVLLDIKEKLDKRQPLS